MADLQDRIGERRRLLERLAGAIPGYAQYQEQEKRRDADKKNRDFLYDDLRTALDSLSAITKRLADEARLDRLAELDRTERRLRTVSDRIRLADYGYAGFFDALKINESDLDVLYQHDLSLTEQVKLIVDKAGVLTAGDDMSARLAELDAAIDALDERFDAREKKIMGVG